MPNERSHLSLANHNQDLLDKLILDIERFPDWAATVAFYKALHVVEAAFACENPVRHGSDHLARERILKNDRRYEVIYRHYRPLYAASMVARYMEDNQTSFTNYMSAHDVIAKLLKHRLHEVEKSALKKLKSPSDLVTFSSRMKTESDDPSE